MPKYTYRCENCNHLFDIYHSIKELKTDCEMCCMRDVLIRIPSEFNIIKNIVEEDNQKVGETTKKHIEESKEKLEDQKKIAREREFKQ